MKTDKRKTYECRGLTPVKAFTKGEARALFKRQLQELSNLTFHPQKVKRLPLGFTVTEQRKKEAAA